MLFTEQNKKNRIWLSQHHFHLFLDFFATKINKMTQKSFGHFFGIWWWRKPLWPQSTPRRETNKHFLRLPLIFLFIHFNLLLNISIFVHGINMDIIGVDTLADFVTPLARIILRLNMSAFNVFEKIAFVSCLILTVTTTPTLSRPQHLRLNFILNAMRI